VTQRGFARAEFLARTARVQAAMAEHDLSALLLTTEPQIRYFTGFLTRFWESPTRPWYLVVPATGEPIAVIPGIGAHLMGQSWISDIRTWSAPDYTDDGIGMLADAVRQTVPDKGQIGVPDGMETHVRMPLADLTRLKMQIGRRDLVTDQGVMRQQRLVKSDAEIAKIAHACAIAGRAFARVPEIARAGVPLETVFRQFQMLCLDEGADWVPYLAGAAGQGGYGDVISPATETPLAAGDVLMLDTGLVWDGYFCDFDRNFSVGAPSPAVQSAHHRLIDATHAGHAAAVPGATAADVFHAMDGVLTGGQGVSDAGRLGHGLGMQLTEWPSLIPADDCVLQPGMVLTLEPGISLPDGQIMVHEEDIVIRDGAAEYLSPPAQHDILLV
jgi:Xaa-Pro aminopeptidase